MALVRIGSADGAPNPTAPGGTLTLTARDVTGVVDQLDFYRESNGIAGLQVATDTLENFAVPGGTPGTYTATAAARFTPGNYTYYAIAVSDTGQRSIEPFQVTVETPPTVTTFTDSLDPAPFNGVINLYASVTDPDAGGVPATVTAYRETNGIPGLQVGFNPDLVLGPMGGPNQGVYALQLLLGSLPPGTYTYYAVARDAFGAPSNAPAITNTIVDAFEPNDRFETAHDLGSSPFGTLTNQAFLDAGDHDFFRMTAPRTTWLKVGVKPDLWTQQVRVNVYDAGRNLVQTAVLDPLGANHYLLAPVTAGQTYYLDFSLASGIPGPYNFDYDYAPTTFGGLLDGPDPQTPGKPVTLTIQSILDENVGSAIFYRESNGTPGLQDGSDTLLGVDAVGADGWEILAPTTGLAAGTYTYYAVGADPTLEAKGNVVSTTNTIQPIPTDPFEPNDSFDAAADLGTLGFADHHNLTIHAPGNDDYYRFVALSGFRTFLNITFKNADGDLGLAVYDAARNLIAQSNTTLDVEVADFPVTAGQSYYVKVYGVSGAVTRDYRLVISVNAPPTIGSLSASPSPQYAGGPVRLTASGAADADGNLYAVSFYRESNNISGFQDGSTGVGDAYLGLDDTPADGFVYDVSTGALPAGTYTYYAVAVDQAAFSSNAVAASSTLVNDQPPRVTSLTDGPDPVMNQATLTLTAVGVTDPDGNLSGVRFYRESNGIDFLQTGPGGDMLLGSDTDPAGGYGFDAPVGGLQPGYYFYYAVAFDALGITSPAAICLNVIHLPGDANLDGKCDFIDLVVLAQNYNTTGKTYAEGDFNFDTKVDFNDLVLLAQNYNTALIPPPPRALPVAGAPQRVPGAAPSVASAARTRRHDALFSTVPVTRPEPAAVKRPASAGRAGPRSAGR